MQIQRTPKFPWECPRELQWSLEKRGNRTKTGIMEEMEAHNNRRNRIRSQTTQPRFLRQTGLRQLIPMQGEEPHVAAMEGVEAEVALEEFEVEVEEEGEEEGQ